jgi:hypothetical protein
LRLFKLSRKTFLASWFHLVALSLRHPSVALIGKFGLRLDPQMDTPAQLELLVNNQKRAGAAAFGFKAAGFESPLAMQAPQLRSSPISQNGKKPLDRS